MTKNSKFIFSGCVIFGIWYNTYFYCSKLDSFNNFKLDEKNKKIISNTINSFEDYPYELIL